MISFWYYRHISKLLSKEVPISMQKVNTDSLQYSRGVTISILNRWEAISILKLGTDTDVDVNQVDSVRSY